jgi:hypothetical protein
MRNTFTALLALAFFFGASMAPSPASAQDLKTVERMSYEQALSTYRDCGLRKRAVDAFVQRMRRSEKATAEPTATINVNYSPDFPAEARAAFSRAVEAWEVRIASPVPIELNARWEALGGNTLGAAGPLFTLVDTNADGSGDTILGFPLYDALTGQDQAPGEPDLVARFNSTRTDWHFGEGPAPPGTLDFTSIVLHEIAHGLGYVDFFYQVGTQISGYGFDFDGSGQVEADEQAPGPYARRLFQRSGSGGAFLTNEAAFSNPSRALGDALTSGQLVFDALQSVRGARESDGPVPPKVYAPATFQPGSSIAHLLARPRRTAGRARSCAASFGILAGRWGRSATDTFPTCTPWKAALRRRTGGFALRGGSTTMRRWRSTLWSGGTSTGLSRWFAASMRTR